ncbi:hypothetical protein WAZ07_11900 [Bacillus sp. FJAT-51639]|uniref:Uncharacterized protein n=1 Tax=Bacillus bruguierae TaxID=3127667 RepID=A0ABU8FH50_9BACI
MRFGDWFEAHHGMSLTEKIQSLRCDGFREGYISQYMLDKYIEFKRLEVTR